VPGIHCLNNWNCDKCQDLSLCVVQLVWEEKQEMLGYAVCNLQFPVGICRVCLRRGCVLCLLQARREFERTTFWSEGKLKILPGDAYSDTGDDDEIIQEHRILGKRQKLDLYRDWLIAFMDSWQKWPCAGCPINHPVVSGNRSRLDVLFALL